MRNSFMLGCRCAPMDHFLCMQSLRICSISHFIKRFLLCNPFAYFCFTAPIFLFLFFEGGGDDDGNVRLCSYWITMLSSRYVSASAVVVCSGNANILSRRDKTFMIMLVFRRIIIYEWHGVRIMKIAFDRSRLCSCPISMFIQMI